MKNNLIFISRLVPTTIKYSTKIKSIINLTYTPFTTDLTDYFQQLNKKNQITKGIHLNKPFTKSPISHTNSKKVQKKERNVM